MPSRPPSAAPSDRVRLRRKRERGRYHREVIDAILDEGLIAHLAFVDEGQPLAIPLLHARQGDLVYLHGSAAGRTLRSLGTGARVCLTVTLIDGLVLARSAMHHSANYRSVMVMGAATAVTEPERKRAALEAIVEHIVPGRWADVRGPSDNELKATSVLSLPIEEASAKIRGGPPADDEEDYALAVWAGVVPLAIEPAAPVADPRLSDAIATPAYASAYRRPRR